jgi:hypothetical protein
MMFEGLNLEASAGDALISVRVNSILENIILWGQFASALRKGGSLISWWDLVLGCWWARQRWIHFRLVVRWSVAADSLISFPGCWFASSAGLHAALLLCSSGGDGWCALESIYSAWSPGSKSSFGGGGGLHNVDFVGAAHGCYKFNSGGRPEMARRPWKWCL